MFRIIFNGAKQRSAIDMRGVVFLKFEIGSSQSHLGRETQDLGRRDPRPGAIARKLLASIFPYEINRLVG